MGDVRHGSVKRVASGVGVWARADRPARMRVEYSTVESFRTTIGVASSDALPDHDFATKVLLEGLPLLYKKSGDFDWPDRAASVRLYLYDEKGDLTGKDTVLKAEAGSPAAAGKPLALTVPKDGIVIAEIVP